MVRVDRVRAHRPERHKRRPQIHASRPIDEHGHPHDRAASPAHRGDGIAHRLTGREHIVHDEDARSRTHPLSAAERATRADFVALGVERAGPDLPGDFLSDQHAAGRRPRDHVNARGEPFDDARAQLLGERRTFEDAELLEVPRRVEAGRKNEVTIEKRAGVAENSLGVVLRQRHFASIPHTMRSGGMRIIDVTLTLRPDMPTWPGEQGPVIEPHSRIADGRPANVSILTFANHTGTHVDPPIHMLEGAASVERMPLESMIGPCRVLRYDGRRSIDAAWLKGQNVPRSVTRLLFRTPNSELWRDPAHAFVKEFVALDETAATWCIEHGIVLVGVDYLSIEPFGSSPKGHPVHKTLLRRDVVIIEGLDLHEVEAGDYELVCLPVKIQHGDGAPARVVLLER
jgi:arylformamidase